MQVLVMKQQRSTKVIQNIRIPFWKPNSATTVTPQCKMALSITGGILSRLVRSSVCTTYSFLTQLDAIQKREYAARKGTREKARKSKVKIEIKKAEFVPHNLRGLSKLKATLKSKRSHQTAREDPEGDNVYVAKYYVTKQYKFTDVVQFHTETHHPSIYNEPNASVNVSIEFNMMAEKKNRFMDSFSRIILLPHSYNHGQERTVLVFCKTPELVKTALEAGADLVGGPEMIRQIQNGELDLKEYRHIIAHPNILPEVVNIRGLLKRRFPMPKNGTLSADLSEAVSRYKKGLEFQVERDTHEHDLGLATVCVGTLDMGPAALEANLAAIVRDLMSVRPRRGGDFITWMWCTSPPSNERFRVDFEPFLAQAETELQALQATQ